ncbi:MAG: tail fiber domain-containing protein [Candidatus Omnitrophota bacterium]|nr:tail fiber domain-containing protein [Candidatus Omnitrophota bacterium]
MSKGFNILSLSVILFLVLFSVCFAEDITITTYYPAPYGSYAELRAQRVAIGDSYSTGNYCWSPATCTNPINVHADLVVEGNVGIGTVNPAHRLEIVTDSTNLLRLTSTAMENMPTGIEFKNAGDITWRIGASVDSTFLYNKFSIYDGLKDVHRLLIDGSGHVGIGTKTPEAKLHLVGDQLLIDPSNFTGLSQGGLIGLRRYDGAKTWFISHGGSATYAMDLLFISSHHATIPYVMRLGMSPVEVEMYGNVTLKNLPSASAMKMIIEGSVGIGRDPATYRLEIAGDAGKTVGGNVWQTLSDSRIKTDIQELKNPIEVINKLHPVKFRYSRDFRRKNNLSENKYYYNFVAQEFQKVFPESVRPDAEGYLYLDTSSVSPYLVAAVQVMDSFIKNQQQEIDGLKTEIAKLQSKIK